MFAAPNPPVALGAAALEGRGGCDTTETSPLRLATTEVTVLATVLPRSAREPVPASAGPGAIAGAWKEEAMAAALGMGVEARPTAPLAVEATAAEELDTAPVTTVTSWLNVDETGVAPEGLLANDGGAPKGLLANAGGGGVVSIAEIPPRTVGQTWGMLQPHEATCDGFEAANVRTVLMPPDGQQPMARPPWPQVVPDKQQLFWTVTVTEVSCVGDGVGDGGGGEAAGEAGGGGGDGSNTAGEAELAEAGV